MLIEIISPDFITIPPGIYGTREVNKLSREADNGWTYLRFYELILMILL